MKKVMYFIGCALFVATMAVSCGSNTENTDTTNDTTNDTTGNKELVDNAATTDQNTTANDDAEMMAAAQKVAQAACACAADETKLDGCIADAINNTADCIKYKDNDKFKSEVKKIALECIMKKGIKKGGNAAIDQYVPDGKTKDAAKNVLNNL